MTLREACPPVEIHRLLPTAKRVPSGLSANRKLHSANRNFRLAG
jgi:hypothetical protein